MKTFTLSKISVALALCGCLVSGVSYAAATCDPAQVGAVAVLSPAQRQSASAELARVERLLEARKASVARMEGDLERIKQEAESVFGETLPSLAERNKLATQASRELRALQPQGEPTPRQRERSERIQQLTTRLHDQQSASVAELDRVQGPTALAAFEAKVKAESEALNQQLAQLYAEEAREFEAALADPMGYKLKKAAWRMAVRWTEIEDRADVIAGAKSALARYQRQAETLRAELSPRKTPRTTCAS